MPRIATFALVFAAAVQAGGCNAFTSAGRDSEEDPGSKNIGQPDAGADGEASVDPIPDASPPPTPPPAPPGCDGTKLPSEDTCVIDDIAGVFVSASLGKADNDGTRDRPLASLTAAIDLAKKNGKRVYACAETYPEAIAIADGVSMFGGFDCTSGWRYGNGRARTMAPSSPAVSAVDIVSPTRIDGFEMVAPAAASGSSIGLRAIRSPGLVFAHGRIEAGAGAKGADGTDGVELRETAQPQGTDGRTPRVCPRFGAQQNCVVHPPAAGGTSDCRGPDGQFTGIRGGAGGSGGSNGTYQKESVFTPGFGTAEISRQLTAPGLGLPEVVTAETNLGGATQPPREGAIGPHGTNGTSGAAIGALSEAGYVPSDGTAGTDGKPGQGGGGGASSYANAGGDFFTNLAVNQKYEGPSGSGGGAGGCPGRAGTPGKGGGASIAVLAVDSPLRFESMTIVAGSGGAGGAGGFGSAPTVGGSGGAAEAPAQRGARGGPGGQAGASGSGGGGPSLGIAYRGAVPQSIDTTITHGPGGAGVPERARGELMVIPASPAGTAAKMISF